jgi:hypothetical protein
MSILSWLSGRLGLTINPATGQRIRTRSVGVDDWGNTKDVFEEFDPYTNSWKLRGWVEGSRSGSHY